jgi:hypothetical protein
MKVHFNEFCYVGIKPCGCVTCATVDSPEHGKDVAKDVSRYIKDGLKVERIPVEEARTRLKRCECKEAPHAN